MAERLPNLSDLRGHNEAAPQTDIGSDSGQISSRQKRLWSLFQQTATSLTHLYKCKSKCQISPEDQEAWLAFQSAASALTSLYRESADILSALEKTNNNSANSVPAKEDNMANDCNQFPVTKLKRSWSGWPDDDSDSFGGGGGGKRRKFL